MNVLETERLLLRNFTLEDAARNYQIYTDPLNMKFMGRPPDSVEVEREHLQRHIDNYYNARGFGLWAVVLKENEALIGRCGLLSQRLDDKPEIEISYLIDNRFWGRGLATEAARAVVRLGFERYDFQRLVAFVNPANTASVRVAEKIGLQYEKDVEYKEFGSVALYVLNKSDFFR